MRAFAVTIDRITHPAGAGGLVVSRSLAERLGSNKIFRLAHAARILRHGPEQLTLDLPNVDPELLTHLDERGIIRAGTPVRPGMILVGRVTPRDPETSPQQSETEDAIDAAFGVRPDVSDSSLRCPRDVEGIVGAVYLAPAPGRPCPPDVLARVELDIRSQRALAIGDVRSAGGRTGVVAAIADSVPDGELCWPGLLGSHDVDKIACALDVAHARSTGPYSIVTGQPLTGTDIRGGQRVHPLHLHALRKRGAFHVIHELTTVKSDDAVGRFFFYGSIITGEPS